jgi:membrane-associated phospholipid phosphatase
MGHIGCILSGNVLSNILKLNIGRPRPDFFAVLGTGANSETPMPDEMAVKTYFECFKSFPSGHTVTASCGAMFLALFLQKVLVLSQFSIFFLKMLPFSYAFYIAGMRVTEHRHHFEDILMGMIIGFLFPICFFMGEQNMMFPDVVKP